MKEAVKNLCVVFVCVSIVLGMLMLYSSQMNTTPSVDDSPPSASQTDDTSVPGVSETEHTTITTPQGEDSGNTSSPSNRGQIYPVGNPRGYRIGSQGLLPATPVAIVTDKSHGKVYFDTCTIAFSLPGKGGTPWAVTAGHCGKVGQKVYSLPRGGNFSTSRQLGTVGYTSVAGEKGSTGDWGVIKLNPRALTPRHTTKIPRNLDTYPRVTGTTLCKNGKTTGFNCGSKGKDNVKTYLSSSDDNKKQTVARMSQVSLCALPGDSGSPIYDKDGIVGVLSSTSASKDEISAQSCYRDNIGYYTPIDKVISGIRQHVPEIIFS